MMRNILGLILLIVPSLTNVIVMGPADLKLQYPDPIRYGIANFGVIPFGKTIKGTALVDTPLNACKDFENKVREGLVEILIADRGNCTFVTKARVAQNAGYALIIIVDNVVELPDQVVLGDDGQGSKIKIPCLIISKADGQGLIDYMYQPHPSHAFLESNAITLNIDFPTNLRNLATLQIGLDLNNDRTYTFLHDIHRFWKHTQTSINVDLIYNLYTCDSCLKKGAQKIDSLEDNCLGGGLYCSYSFSIDSSDQLIQGREMVLEVVRQLCIISSGHNQWWKYMKQYHLKCFHQTANLATCSRDVMSENIQSPTQVALDRCVSDSFNIPEKFDLQNPNHIKLPNSLLKEQLGLIKKAGLKFFPGAIVNNINFMGNLNGPNVFEEICSSLKTPPQMCADFEAQGEDYFHQKKDESHNVLHIVLAVVLVLSIFFVLLFYFYRRWAKKRMVEEMSGQVNQMVSNYIQFSERSKG